MTNLSRAELIKALIKGLKLDDNIFNYQAVAEETEQIQESQFMDFFKAVMSEDTFGNGLKAVIKVAEQFKPQGQVDVIEAEAIRLIDLVKAMNNQIFEDAKAHGVTFDELLAIVKFPKVSIEDKRILMQVKPYIDAKQLIAKINHYATSKEQLEAFKKAITYSEQIENLNVKRLMNAN